ncbi:MULTISPECIES: hypothetical protein [unclassified Duganella]|uniref:hypothetical protein n=1 Tax=unclassified Duganella TaxID=2636909 RepID=UPI0006F6205C|nr:MULTISPECIES: hypothetical protein [unclassified Duganella]KQV44636.1 hypothetical protein ASD07_18945 [Duganella sp. Root336D2]KRB83157.1 hypothetical protein ASE26_11780 [Duganella sp. Root198D2]
MAAQAIRLAFRLLLALQFAILVLLEHAGLTRLRITEFGARGNPDTWDVLVAVLNIGFAVTYLAAVFISARSTKFFGIEAWPSRLAHLGMTLTCPVAVWLAYGVLFGYPAS